MNGRVAEVEARSTLVRYVPMLDFGCRDSMSVRPLRSKRKSKRADVISVADNGCPQDALADPTDGEMARHRARRSMGKIGGDVSTWMVPSSSNPWRS